MTVEEGFVFDPTIHPDGDLITYSARVDGTDRLFFRSTSGGPPTPVASNFDRPQIRAEYSPDGSRLLFKSYNSIYLVDAPRGVPTPLFVGGSGGFLRTATWSPDGKSVAMTKGDTLIVVDVQTRTYDVLGVSVHPHSPAWSPDGKRIAVVLDGRDQLSPFSAGSTSKTGISIYSIDGSEPQILLDDEHQNLSPIWTPDGKKLLFTSDRGGGHDIWSINVSGPPELNRITTGFDFFVIGLSEDGRRLVANENYVSAQNLHKVSHLSAETSVWSDALPVTTGEQIVESVAVSPDERWIAYGSNISGDVNIFMMPLPEGSAVQVTSDPAFDFVSGWSPDSKSILFYSLRNGTRDVFSADINDLSIQSIYQRDDDLWFPSMSSDGQFIGFASGTIPRDYEIIRRGEDGSWGDPKIVATNVHTINAFSPKGNMLALIYQGGGFAIVDVSVEPPRELHQIPDAGAVAPVWSPDGNTLFAAGNDVDGWGLAALEVKTGEIRKIFSGGVTGRGSLTFAADNEFLYFTKLEQTTNIWVLDLVYE